LLGCMSCWGAVFFLAVTLQTTLGLRPVLAGLVLTPIYIVMMVGSPLAARLAERYGPAWPIIGGLIVYAGGLWLLTGVGAGSSLTFVLTGLGVFAVGMAAFTAPLATVTLSALDDSDQGLASGVNNAMGQVAGLLAIIVLPAAAGLTSAATFGGPEFAAGYPTALRAAAAIAVAAVLIAAFTFWPAPREPTSSLWKPTPGEFSGRS
jgi:MFS family permease